MILERWTRAAMIAVVMVMTAGAGWSADAPEQKGQEQEKRSPWLLLPTLSSDPKLGTALGVIGAYLHYFDERSQPSMFGVVAQYTSTDSTVGGVFIKTSSGEDHHRVAVFGGGGVIKNDYEDFLGSGKPLETTDDLRVLAARYQYRVYDDWFVGLQATSTNYLILGQTALDEQVLNTLGLTGFRSTGAGVIVMHDSRDNDNAPLKGWILNMNNLAYRKSLSGDEDFDVYRLDAKAFWEHGGHVFAMRQNNHWSVDAPASASASVTLRGYKMGQYLGAYMSSLEAEERLRFAKVWGATVFAGIACLYGDGNDCSDSGHRYPSYGAGIQYFVKQKERIVLNLEYAEGKADNYGVYLKMGYGF